MLLAALATIRPTEIEAAVAALSASGKAILRSALPLIEQRLSKQFPAALDELNAAIDRDTDHLIP
jgi:hypothetical protein